MNEHSRMMRIFGLALGVRWTVAIALYFAMGNDGFFGTDSRGYYGWISDHVERLQLGQVSGWQWLGPNISLLPLPSLLWTANGVLFGQHAALTSVLCQGMLDSGTCVLIYLIGREIEVRIALPAGVCAAINPTQVVMADLYYTDSIFLFFFALTLLGLVRWLKDPSWMAALLSGAGVGAALLCRVVIAPWAAFAAIFLVAALTRRGNLKLRHLAQVTFAGLLAAALAAPVVMRNHAETGEWALTVQTASHTAFWVAPLVMQASDGTPWERGAAEMRRRIEARYGQERADQTETFRRQAELAREALIELGPGAIFKAWTYGIMINLGAPIASIFPPLAQLPRTGFYATPGNSMAEKIANFLLRSDNAIYAWGLIAGLAGLAAFRLVQLRGALALLTRTGNLPVVLLLLSWVAFILLISGPVASPKYRLPIEPVLAVLAAAGYVALRKRPH